MCILFISLPFPSYSADISASSGHCRPSRSSNLMPRLAVVGVVLPLSSRTASSRKQKYFRL